MQIDNLTVVSTTGGNRRPHSGDVTFSDGKAYGWTRLPDESIGFFGSRKRHGEWEMFSLASPKRAALVLARIDGDDCPGVKVIDVKTGL